MKNLIQKYGFEEVHTGGGNFSYVKYFDQDERGIQATISVDYSREINYQTRLGDNVEIMLFDSDDWADFNAYFDQCYTVAYFMENFDSIIREVSDEVTKIRGDQ